MMKRRTSPSQYGSILINGAGGKYGKFGFIHDYNIDHRTEKQKESWALTQIYEAVNHSVKRYVEDVENMVVEEAVSPELGMNTRIGTVEQSPDMIESYISPCPHHSGIRIAIVLFSFFDEDIRRYTFLHLLQFPCGHWDRESR